MYTYNNTDMQSLILWAELVFVLKNPSRHNEARRSYISTRTYMRTYIPDCEGGIINRCWTRRIQWHTPLTEIDHFHCKKHWKGGWVKRFVTFDYMYMTKMVSVWLLSDLTGEHFHYQYLQIQQQIHHLWNYNITRQRWHMLNLYKLSWVKTKSRPIIW